MSFVFYPNHEHGCSHVNHCPHLGSVGLGTLVQGANENDESRRYLLASLDAERERNARLSDENERLKAELAEVKLELKLERQNKFATNQQKRVEKPAGTEPAADPSQAAKKRSAPSVILVGFERRPPNTIGRWMLLPRSVARTVAAACQSILRAVPPNTCRKT